MCSLSKSRMISLDFFDASIALCGRPLLAVRMKSQRSTSARNRGSSRKGSHLGSGQPDKMHVPRRIGAVEPLESRIALAKSGVHQRHCIRRHVLFASNAFQRTQHFLGLVRASQLRQDVSSK